MASFNSITLVGNCTRDPELKQLPSQTTVAEFGLAVNRKYRTAGGEDKEETLFIDCAAFGKQADVIGQYVQKGKALLVSGRLKMDQWEDKSGGGKRTKHSVVVDNFQFLGGPRDGGDDNAPPPAQNRGQQRPQQGGNRPAPAARGNGNGGGGGNRAREAWGQDGDDFPA